MFIFLLWYWIENRWLARLYEKRCSVSSRNTLSIPNSNFQWLKDLSQNSKLESIWCLVVFHVNFLIDHCSLDLFTWLHLLRAIWLNSKEFLIFSHLQAKLLGKHLNSTSWKQVTGVKWIALIRNWPLCRHRVERQRRRSSLPPGTLRGCRAASIRKRSFE